MAPTTVIAATCRLPLYLNMQRSSVRPGTFIQKEWRLSAVSPASQFPLPRLERAKKQLNCRAESSSSPPPAAVGSQPKDLSTWEPFAMGLDSAADTAESGTSESKSSGVATSPSSGGAVGVMEPPPSEAPTRSSGEGEEQPGEAARGEGARAFRWEKHWYPVSLTEDLDPSLPTPFTLLGQDMVLWRDAQGVWRAHRDLCPHRLAPLSEGRLDSKTGDLQCSYHGWTFRGDGTCSGIPQADKTGPESRASSSPRACVAVFPTLVSQGMLFVWPEAGNWAEALAQEPLRLPPEFEQEGFANVTIQRDLFYGWDVLMENVADPSHIEFAHHKVTGRRDRARPLPFEISELKPQGFTATAPGNPKISAHFLPPVGIFSKLEFSLDLPLLGHQDWTLWICSFNIPMAPGKTRSIVYSTRNFALWSVPGNQWWQLYPRWLEHLTSNKVYDGDMIVLKGQERVLADDANRGRSYGSVTYTPTAADRIVLAFHNWLRRFGGGEPSWNLSSSSSSGVPAGTARTPLPSTQLGKRDMLDRLSSHTEKCSSCRGAYRNVRRGAVALGALAALLLALAPLPTDALPRLALSALALLAAGVGAYLKLVLEPQFVFVDYVHADIED